MQTRAGKDRISLTWFSSLATLLLCGIGSAAIYGLMALAYPLASHAAAMNQNLRVLVEAPAATRILIVAGILLLFFQFTLGLRAIRAARAHRHLPRLIVGFSLIFSLLLLLTYPATSSDLYDYLFRGRMAAHYGANPFITTPQAFSADPLFPLVGWPRAVTAYGPVWELLSWLVARLAGERPVAQSLAGAGGAPLLRLLLGYKLLGALGFLLCGVAIWWALGELAPDQRPSGLYLWLWNPLALWELAGAGHNDGWMLLPMIMAVGMVALLARPRRPILWLEARAIRLERPAFRPNGALQFAWTISPSRPIARETPLAPAYPRARRAMSRADASTTVALSALALLTVGALIKYLPLVLGPVLLAAAARRLPNWRQRWRLALLSALACLALILLAYAPFWDGIGTFHNMSDRRAIFSVSWLNGLRMALAATGVRDDPARTIAALTGLLLLLAGTAWATWRSWRNPAGVVSHVIWLLLWMIFVCNPTTQGWYLLWPLAIAALQPGRTRLIGALNLCACAALIAYVVSSFVIPFVGAS